MKVQKYTLMFYVACFVGFSIPALIAPEMFASLLGYELARDGALMEFVGAYGGLIAGVGAYLVYCLRHNVKAGLICVLAVIAALFIGRLMGYGLEGEMNTVQGVFLVIELITIALVSYVLYLAKQQHFAQPAS